MEGRPIDVTKCVRVHLLANILRTAEAVEVLVEAGSTAARIATENRHPSWSSGARLVACVGGRKLTTEEWSMPLGEGVDLVLCPDPRGIDPLTIVILLAVSIAVNFAYTALVGTPEVPGVPQQRGFDRSQTFAWDRIHSEYRPGFPVPLLYGLHDVGGQAIYTNVQASPGGINIGPNELLRIVLALSDGRIEAVGEVTGDDLGEVDGLGGFSGQPVAPGAAIPKDIRVNGNRLDHTKTGTLNPATGFWENLPGAKVWLRLGEIAQSPLPSNPFFGISSTEIVGAQLPDAQSSWVHTISDTREIGNLDVVLDFPSGLYQQDNQGNISRYPSTGSLDFLVEYRPVGIGAWRPLGIASVNVPPILSQFAINRGFAVAFNGQPVPGPIEVQVTRLTPAGGTQVVSGCTWRQTNYALNHVFAYPRTALIGLEIMATETTVGARPGFVIRCKGRKLRVYDATIGSNDPSTERYWEVPPAGDPYVGIWSYPPGRNPAWILADFVTSTEGLGAWFTDAQLDWDAIRDWADFCDQDVSVSMVNEALCTFDAPLDEPKQAWDYILQICQAGRAVPVLRGNKLSVVYQYSSAHGRGTNSVPARTATQLICTSNVRDFSVEYRNTRLRPATIILQILNETKDYVHDPIPVQDPLGGFDDVEAVNPLRFVKMTVQLFGVTRPSQAEREGLFMHAANREIRSTISFHIGPEALAATVGDVIAVQHDIFRPYDSEAFSMRMTSGGAARTDVTLNREVTLAPATTYEIAYRDANNQKQTTVVTATPGTYAAGDPIAITGTINVDAGSPCVLGLQDALTKDYQIVFVSMEEDLSRKVVAVDWVPSIHTIGSQDNPPESGGSAEEQNYLQQSTDLDLLDDNSARVATDISLRKLPSTRNSYELTWVQPLGDHGRIARIYVRPNGSQTWWSMGQTKGQQQRLVLTAGEIYDIAVSISDRTSGVFQLPDEAGQATLTADEFAPVHVPSLHGLRIGESYLDGTMIRWSPVDTSHLDYLEGRWGGNWNGAALAFRTREPEINLLYPMTRKSGAAVPLMIRARHREGLYSSGVLVSAAPTSAMEVLASTNADAATYTKTNVTEGSGGTYFQPTFKLNAGEVWGEVTIEDEETYSLGFDADAILLLSWVQYAIDQMTVDEATFSIDSGEALWRSVDGREATPAIPGANYDEIVDAFTMQIDDAPDDRLVDVYRGQPGAHTSVKVFVKYALLSETLSEQNWEEYEPRRRSFAKWGIKIELERDDADAVELHVEGVRQEIIVP